MKYNVVAYDEGCIMQEPEAEDDGSGSDSESSSEESISSEESEVEDSGAIVFQVSARCQYVRIRTECLIPFVNKHNVLMSTLLVQQPQNSHYATLGKQHKLAYKMVRTESRIVHALLTAYGFNQVHMNSNDFNLMWHGGHVKPISLRALQDFQRVNHFPRSYELTRKDRMYANMVKMQQTHGMKHFDFVAKSFILPLEYQEFMSFYQREHNRKQNATWIIKPVASSRGRGIYLVNNINHIPLDENIIVGRYIDNPLLIDGFKFDIRLYVAVTSYDPLMIYLYEEGLTRFCTIKYDRKNSASSRNLRMHLTNYSLNKKSMDYVRCDNPDVEDYGNKWSMSAMLRYLRESGIDTNDLCARIEDVVVKAIISVELPVATATKMFVPNPRGNCAELYGFDIMVDDQLKPWLLEVNLSPSLATDTPLDLKIKSTCVADWLNLIGINTIDPVSKNKALKEENAHGRNGKLLRPQSSRLSSYSPSGNDRDLSSEEGKIVRWAREQDQRKGGFLRVFPRPDSWEKYGRFLQHRTTYNSLLARRLFRDSGSGSNTPIGVDSRISSAASSSAGSSSGIPIVSKFARNRAMAERVLQYERKLLNMIERRDRTIKERAARRQKRRTDRKKPLAIKDSKRTTAENRLLAKRAMQTRPQTAKVIGDPYRPKPKSEILKNVTHNNHTTVVLKEKDKIDQKDGSDSTSSRAATPVSKPTLKSIEPYANKPKSLQPAHNMTRMTSKPSSSQSSRRPATIGTAGASHPGAGNHEMAKNAMSSSTVSATNIRIKAKKVYQTLKGTSHGPDFLSAIEARRAFHSYLCRVQIRLSQEAGQDPASIPISEQKQEQQLALVTRFLVRAAENLPTPLPITVPSKDQFNLVTRKKLIASQLSIFVQKYQTETERQQSLSYTSRDESSQKSDQPKSSSRQDTSARRPHTTAVSTRESAAMLTENKHQFNKDFDVFVRNATENELEDVLTLYTKRNKSAAIFLGTKPAPKSISKPAIVGADGGARSTTSYRSRQISGPPTIRNHGSGDASSATFSPKPTPQIRHRAPTVPSKTVPSAEEQKVIDALQRLGSGKPPTLVKAVPDGQTVSTMDDKAIPNTIRPWR